MALLATMPNALAAPDGNPPGTGWTPDQNVLGYVEQSDELTRFLALLRLAGLTGMLRQAGPVTLLAPTNAAFDAMPPQMIIDLQRPVNRPALVRILECHILPGRVTIDTLEQARSGNRPIRLKSVNGCPLTVSQRPSGLSIDDADGIEAELVHADVGESNGLVQVIDGVLTPKVSKPPA